MASTSSDVLSNKSNLLMSHQLNIGEEYENDSIERMFYKKLVEYDDNHSGSNRKPWTQERILEVIKDLKNIKVTMKKKSVDYYWMNKYEVITTASEEYLIAKKKHYSEPTVRIVAREHYFDLLSEIHLSCGHGGRDKMLQEIKSKFYIPKKAIEIFVMLCPICNSKRNNYKNENVRPATSEDIGEGGQFELIDFQPCADGDYKFILIYQNIATKFIILRPLKTPSIAEVASELLITFLTLGSPNTLQSDLGNDFTEDILKELSTMWPGCTITLGSQYNFHSNSKEVKSLLQMWMTENNSTNWSIGCFFVQYNKNITFHRTLGKMPYEAFFGCAPKSGVYSSLTAPSILSEQESLKDRPQSGDIKLEIEEDRTSPSDSLNPQCDVEVKLTPPACDNESTDAYKCKSCNSTVHIICGVFNDDQGHSLKVSCYICKNVQVMELERNQGLKRAGEEITCEKPNKMATLDKGQTVLVSVPKASGCQFNMKSITGKIVDLRYGVYKVATKIGTIKNWFPRYDLESVEADYGEVSEKRVSLDEVVANQAASRVQVFNKCNCRPAVNQCHTNRCICYKNKALCGTKCHQNLTCINT